MSVIRTTAALALGLAACGGPEDVFELATVARVIDGDTVELGDGRRVRYLMLDTPVATNSCIPITKDFSGSLRGSNHPYSAAKLDALYSNEAKYLARFEEAAQRAVSAGVLLPRDVAPAIEEAAQEYRRAYAMK